MAHAKVGASRAAISLSFSEKMPRSSVASIDATEVPSTRTPYFSRIPAFSSSIPQLRPVWPPIDRMIPSGRSRSITCSTYSRVTGSRYTLSGLACPWPSTFVCTDAMFGLISTTCTPSSFIAVIACEPE